MRRLILALLLVSPAALARPPRIRGPRGETLSPAAEARLAHARRQGYLARWGALTNDAPTSKASDATWLATQPDVVKQLAKLIVATTND